VTRCTICKLPDDVRERITGMVDDGMSLRAIASKLTDDGITTNKDRLHRHLNHGSDQDELEIRALCAALREVLPTYPADVTLALVVAVQRRGAGELADALRTLMRKSEAATTAAPGVAAGSGSRRVASQLEMETPWTTASV
jgi:hypothetical protein